jgi:large subunit ribosomal protein L29
MAVLKAEELRSKSLDELKTQLTSLKKEAFNLRFQGATGQLENPARMRLVRREIARVKTVLAEKSSATSVQE